MNSLASLELEELNGPENPQDAAFVGSFGQPQDGPEMLIGGKKVNALGALHISAAQGMGLRWPNIPEEHSESGIYPGMANDVVILSWLSTITDPEVFTAIANPKKAIAAAYEFGAKAQILYPAPGFARACALIGPQLERIGKASAEPAEVGSPGKA